VIEGTATNPTFTRRSHNSFTLATRAVETARALKNRGFDNELIRIVMERTRTHVGTAELSLDQWIAIAVGYCAKATSS